MILPAALPGIVGAVVLAASRAIGETMIVVLAAGALSNVTGLEPNPFGAVVTVTTRIVAVLLGEGSGFDSIDVLAVFSLGLHALLHHAWAQPAGAADRCQIPGAV